MSEWHVNPLLFAEVIVHYSSRLSALSEGESRQKRENLITEAIHSWIWRNCSAQLIGSNSVRHLYQRRPCCAGVREYIIDSFLHNGSMSCLGKWLLGNKLSKWQRCSVKTRCDIFLGQTILLSAENAVLYNSHRLLEPWGRDLSVCMLSSHSEKGN